LHDRDLNAAINILEVVQPKAKVETTETKAIETPVQLSLFALSRRSRSVPEGRGTGRLFIGHGGSVATGKPAFSNDVSTHSESFVQRMSVRVMDENPALSRRAASGGCQ